MSTTATKFTADQLREMLANAEREAVAPLATQLITHVIDDQDGCITGKVTKPGQTPWVGNSTHIAYTDDQGREWGIKVIVTAKNHLARKGARTS